MLLFTLLTLKPAQAETPEALEPYLTGGTSRIWSVEGKPWVAKLGSGCESGERWTFDSQQTWTVTTCVEGKSQSKHGTWTWDQSAADLVAIQLDKATYLFAIRKRKPDVAGDPELLVAEFRTKKHNAEDTVFVTRLTYQDF